jgi:hypothetical protein
MGFQQYLLLVLAAIIVSVAIVLGINQFRDNAKLTDEDAMVQDALNIASKAQSWYARRNTLGGGNNSFNNLSLEKLGVPSKNDNGEYFLEVLSSDKVKITGRGVEGNGVEVTVSPNSIQSITFSNGEEKTAGVNSGPATATAIAANSIKETEVDNPNTDKLSLSNAKSDSVKVSESQQHASLKPQKPKRKKHYGLGAGCAKDERK